VPKNDLLATDQHFPDRIGEIYQLAHGEAHQWYYAPLMNRDEIILIKGWDTLEDGRARYTPHGAFQLPNQDQSAPPRESIETRTFLVIEAT
ncbi:MAG: CmcJ/NvfI family oxidoreductase, partial [Alphaproteobacteria bacterium]